MSTRAVIAVGLPETWQGVYVHFDGNPTHLGKAIWDFIKNHGISKFENVIELHRPGFEQFPSRPYPMKTRDAIFTSKNKDWTMQDYWYLVNPMQKRLYIRRYGRNEMVVDLKGPEPDWKGVETDLRARSNPVRPKLVTLQSGKRVLVKTNPHEAETREMAEVFLARAKSAVRGGFLYEAKHHIKLAIRYIDRALRIQGEDKVVHIRDEEHD